MSSLNEAQQRAVETTEGPLLIIAGAESGKTRVITHRILSLIKKGIAPTAILAITFTNKAANEMKERVGNLLSEDKTLNMPVSMNERSFISTFHALGAHILRENAVLAGLSRHFTIADKTDAKRIIKEAMEKCSLDTKAFDPGAILNMISRAKGNGLDNSRFAVQADSFSEKTAARVWKEYESILEKEKTLDFDDLLLKTADLLAKHPSIREHYAKRWLYIHIDEYQDTNRVQYQISKYLASSRRNICAVGDADQNIYSWRGATIENILNFEKDYPETVVITLEKNYRSTKTILSAANHIISKNVLRKKKTLYTDNDHGDKISLMAAYTESDEAWSIADRVVSLIDSGTNHQEIAVLYRANFQSRALEEAFIKRNIPYQLVGVRFFERKEIKDTLSYIRAALNRENWGDIVRTINTPPRGIGKATVAKIISGREDLIPTATAGKIAHFWRLLDNIHGKIKSEKPSETIKSVLKQTGMEELFRKGNAEDEERLLNIYELVSVATQYDHMAPLDGIEALLTNAALATDQDELDTQKQAVKLMTVHASKGLEFEHIFIAGLEQDLFPFKRHNDRDGQNVDEEERRLFYVALTRAKQRLYLSHAVLRTMYGTQKVSAPSEFITDIAEELIEETLPGKPTGAKAIFIDF